jgi:hypothetical protein
MLEQKKNLQEFIPALILTPEQKLRLIEEKVKRAEAHLKKLNEVVNKLPIR